MVKQKIGVLLVVVVLALFAAPAAFADEYQAGTPSPDLKAQDTGTIVDECGTCFWTLEPDGTLTIAPMDGIEGTLGENSPSWIKHKDSITSVKFKGKVHTGKSALLFSGLSNATVINLRNLDMSEANADAFHYMFSGCSSLTELDFSNLNAPAGYSFSQMFFGCSSLKTLDLSSLKARPADYGKISMDSMFQNCKSLTSVKMPQFADGKPAVDFTNLFYGCSSLESIDWNATALKSTGIGLESMLEGCAKLASVDLAWLDTSEATSFNSMFSGCSSLKAVDVTGFETTKDIRYEKMFMGCSSLQTLDLSSFKRCNSLSKMFNGCSSLKTIYANSEWAESVFISKLQREYVVFEGCTSLVGGAGTKFDPANDKLPYARIDTASNPGYFTLKGVSAAAENTSGTNATETSTPASKTPKITLKKSTKSVTVKAAKQKSQWFKIGAKCTSGGKLTYKVTKGNKKLVFKNGKVTLKQGTYKKGKTYSMKVKITSAPKGDYAKGAKTFTLKFKIK